MRISIRDNYFNKTNCEKSENYIGDDALVILIICGRFLRKLFAVEEWIEIVFANGKVFVLKDA